MMASSQVNFMDSTITKQILTKTKTLLCLKTKPNQTKQLKILKIYLSVNRNGTTEYFNA